MQQKVTEYIPPTSPEQIIQEIFRLSSELDKMIEESKKPSEVYKHAKF